MVKVSLTEVKIVVEANTMLRARLEETTLVEVEAVINSNMAP